MDQDAQERLGVLGVALPDRVLQRVGGRVQLGGVGRVWGFCGELVRELGVLVAEGVELALERVHAALEALRVEVAVLEGVEVAVDRALGALDLGGDRCAAVFQRRALVLLTLRCLFDRGADEITVAIDPGELLDDGVLQLLAWDAVAVAGFGSALLAAGAGVVVVEAAVASRRHADVGAAAAPAAQESGQEKVAALADALGAVLATLLEQRLRASERRLVHEARVVAVEGLSAPVDAADVGLVAQDQQHDRRLPALPVAGGCVLGVKQAGDRNRAVAAGGVEVEDSSHDRRLALLLDLLEPWTPSPTRALTIWENWPADRPQFVIEEDVVGEGGEPPRSHHSIYAVGRSWRAFSFNFAWSGDDPVRVIQMWLARFTAERS